MSGGPSSPEGTHVVTGNEAMNKLIEIWFNGFISGAASGGTQIAVYAGLENNPQVQELIDKVALKVTAAAHADPLAVEAVRREITETFLGIDSGPKAFSVAEARCPACVAKQDGT